VLAAADGFIQQPLEDQGTSEEVLGCCTMLLGFMPPQDRLMDKTLTAFWQERSALIA
jgi:hypothetical protein